MTFPRSTVTQSILFDRDFWTLSSARAWLKRHGYKVPKVDTTENYYRFRQLPPSKFVKTALRTKSFGDETGIKAIIGMPKRSKNPSSVRIPRRVVSLGRCVELIFVDGTTWKPRRYTTHLCSSESGKTLWILTVSKENTKVVPESKLYQQFTGYVVSGARIANVREPSSLSRSRQVKSIVYESDKWDNKKREYIHTFRTKPRAYTDNIGNPSFVKISGGRIRVKPEGITG